MTRSFATEFNRVVALDVSPEMLRQGAALNADMPNIEWKLANGADLGAFRDSTFDLVFSYLVLHHFPRNASPSAWSAR